MEPKDYTDNQIGWLKENFDNEVRAIRDAVSKVEEVNKDYRKSQNEWRGALDDSTSKLETKEAVNQIVKRVEKLENMISNLQGRLWMIAALWGVIIIIVGWFLSK